MSDEARVTHEDLRTLGYCNVGVRRWLRQRGLSWPKLLRDGLTLRELEPYLTDVQCGEAVANARARMRGDPPAVRRPFRAAGRAPRGPVR